jgi:hypothetical protein
MCPISSSVAACLLDPWCHSPVTPGCSHLVACLPCVPFCVCIFSRSRPLFPLGVIGFLCADTSLLSALQRMSKALGFLAGQVGERLSSPHLCCYRLVHPPPHPPPPPPPPHARTPSRNPTVCICTAQLCGGSCPALLCTQHPSSVAPTLYLALTCSAACNPPCRGQVGVDNPKREFDEEDTNLPVIWSMTKAQVKALQGVHPTGPK